MEIVKKILNSFEEEEGRAGSLGLLLKASIEKNQKDNEEYFDVVFSPEVDAGIRRTKKWEEENNLVWMDNISWSLLSPDVKDAFRTELDLFEWRGAYFPFREFEEKLKVVLRDIEKKNSVFVLDSHTHYRVIVIGGEDQVYDYYSYLDLSLLSDKIRNQLIFSVGKNSDEDLILKDCRGEATPSGKYKTEILN